MSSEKFESLEDDLTTILDSLKDRIERKIPTYSGGNDRTLTLHNIAKKTKSFCNL